MLDPVIREKHGELLSHKLGSVVGDESCWDLEAGDNLISNEPDGVFLSYGSECFGFSPFSHIVDGDHNKLELALSFGERTHDANAPYGEWDR